MAESDEDLALAMEGTKQDAKEAVHEVQVALLDESEPLTPEKVQRLVEVGDDLAAFTRALVARVPDEQVGAGDGE